MRKSTVIMRFIDSGTQKKALQVQGSGRQFRQFTHVTDIAAAHEKSLKYNGGSDTFNVVSDEKTTIVELANLVREVFDVPIEFVESREGEPPSIAVSSELAKLELDWHARAKFRSSLLRLISDPHREG